jgi:hypothetical protein
MAPSCSTAATPVVLPVAFEGVQLAQYTGSTVQVGLDVAVGVLSVSDLAPGTNPYGLYVTEISNSVDGQIQSDGSLSMTFSRPVVLNTSASMVFGAALSGSSGVLDGTNPVIVEISADGLTLTLRPRYTTTPVATDRGSYITYADGSATVSVRGYPADAFDLFDLYGSDNALISGRVNLTQP